MSDREIEDMHCDLRFNRCVVSYFASALLKCINEKKTEIVEDMRWKHFAPLPIQLTDCCFFHKDSGPGHKFVFESYMTLNVHTMKW